MKVQLYVKKLGANGHIPLNIVDIPDGMWEWRIPVNQPIKVVSSLEIERTPQDVICPVRLFRRQDSPLDRITDPRPLPRFLEV